MSSYAVVDPATGERIREYAALSDRDVELKVARAEASYRHWGRTAPVDERASFLRRASELYTERRDELAAIIRREMGKPVVQALGEVDFCAAVLRYYADNAKALVADQTLDLQWGEGSAVVRRAPLGVLLGVMPWNYPYLQVVRFAAPNLLLGNTIVLKHASQCPESAAAIEALFLEAGFPEGAYENLYATYDQVDRLIADPRVVGVSVTGSEQVGAHVAELAGRNLKKVVLELGGSDPFVVLSTDDLDATVEAALMARFYDNAGQMCSGAKRFIIIDALYEPFLDKLKERLVALPLGDPRSEETVIGPVSSEGAARFLEDQLHRAVAAGAAIATGGSRSGAFVVPTVLTDIAPDNQPAREEFFGPVACMYRVASEEEAVAVANDTPFGLGSYLFTTDAEQAQRVADQLDVGMVYVNVAGAEEPGLPFGGVKASGFGRELGPFAVDEFANRKLIRVGA